MLAGNVVASVAGGYLQLIGDAASNQLEVTRVGTSSVLITSLDGTTRINNSTSPQLFNNVINGVTAVTGDGHDVLELSGTSTAVLRFFGNTSINTGNGDDTVRFTDVAIGGSLYVFTGAGNDTVIGEHDASATAILEGGLRVSGPAVISTSVGDDFISLRNSFFNSNLMIDGSVGNDIIDIRNTEVRRIASLLGSVGTDTLNTVANTFRFAPFIFQIETQTTTAGPSAGNDLAVVAEGGSVTINVLANDVATSGTINTGSVAIVTNPLHGTAVANANGTITYTNDGSEFATDTFTYTVLDSSGNISNTATVTVNVSPVNDLPVAANNSFTVNEGATATLNLGANDTDAEGRLNLNSIVIVQQPANGTVTVGANGNVTYASNGAEVISDSFTYTIADLNGGVSLPGTVSITITPVNDAPTVGALANVAVNEDTATGAIAVTVNDAETPAASLNVTATSSNTTLVPNANIVVGGSGTARTLTITPAANQSGTSTITVRVTDANNLTTTTTFQLTVNAVNDPPTITAVGDVSINEDTTAGAIGFTIGDVETAATSLNVTATSSNTNVIANNGISIQGSGASRTVTVTPLLNASGTSTITLNVSDGTTTTSETFVVTVNAQNDLPTITAIADLGAAVGVATSPIAFTIGDVETAATSLTVTAASSDQNVVQNTGIQVTGTGAARAIVITPVATGTTTITVRVTDGANAFVEETFVLTVNAPPTITAIADVNINEDANTGNIAFTVGDAETPVANLTLSATSSNTTLVPVNNITFGGSGANRTVLVTPVANVSGSSTITVRVSDATGLSTTETFVVNVAEVNDPPTLSAIANINVQEDATINPFTITIGDVETPASNLTVTATSSNQALLADNAISITQTGNVRTITLAPTANAFGAATITVQVADANNGTATQQFTLNVAAVNDAPVAGAVTETVLESGPVVIDLGAVSSDVDSALNLAAGITITQAPLHGSIMINGDGTVTYTHDDSETTSDSFRYIIRDVQGLASAAATVNLTVEPINDSPVAENDTFSINFAAQSSIALHITGNVLTNDTDPDSPLSSLSVAGTTEGDVGTDIVLTYGTLVINADGTFDFELNPLALATITSGTILPEFIGYEVTDGESTGFGLLTLTINVI